jgi:tetratricopeptide (TPR) repeat protein/tRNA A-37 threonylcarbamoyl transferase component Bud32
MSEPIQTVDEPLAPRYALHVNEVCDRFEAVWKAAGPGAPLPRIEEHLGDTPEPERSALLRRLVILDLDWRRRRGEAPTAEDYQSRFPALSAGFLSGAFPGPASREADGQAAPRGPLSLSVEEKLDPICVRFETGWKAGLTPQLEGCLENVAAGLREPLLRELLQIELHHRRRKGESPTSEEYGRRFPGREELIRSLFAAAPSLTIPDKTVLTHPVAPPLRPERYVVRQLHAQGGIGEVWLARDAEIGREVALKRLRKNREAAHGRFLAEAQITGQLEHPGIVPVHDLGLDEEGRPFYVMTFIRGRTLRDAIDEYHAPGPADREPAEVRFSRLLETFVKVCQAVGYAHSRGVIHRDLKPENVMLGEYGETLVVDWGMAKVRNQPESPGGQDSVHLCYSGGSTETQAGLVIGSPAYMAPEMAEGRASDADERTDVYLLGSTLYHLLTGYLPRQGLNASEVVNLARTGPPPPPRQVKADVPRGLDAICVKAMAHCPQDRYAGALELADDVRRFLAGAPVSAYREPLLARAWRWCKRHRRGLGRALAGAVVLGLALLGAALVRDAWSKQEALRRDAEERRRCDQARHDLADFRRLAEERQFYAALTTPAGEQPLHYDPGRGERAGQQALALASTLTEEMADLPLPAEREALRNELHELRLLLAQAQGRHSPGPGEVPETALDHFLRAEQFRTRAFSPASESGDGTDWQPDSDLLHKAVGHYEKAIQIDPRYEWAHFHLGRCYLSLGQGSEAVEALNTFVALRPNAPWGYSARGLALGLTRRFEAGEADLDRALALEPDFLPALLNRGVLAWLQRKYDRALADFAQVLEAPPEKRLVEAAYYRGQLHLERGKRREAREDFDRVVKENPGFRPVYLNRAQVHFLQGDNDRGLADLTTFLDLGRPTPLDPNGPAGFALRGRLLRQLIPNWGLPPAGQRAALELARAELDRAVRLGGRSADLSDDLGSVLELLGRPEGALAAYAEALKTAGPKLKVKVLSKRGWLYAQAFGPPRVDRAREEFTRVLRLEAQNADAHTGLGYLWARQHRPAEAQREAAAALLHGAGDYLALHNVACIYAELSQVDPGQSGQHAEMAVSVLRRAVELWGRRKVGPNELALIREERSFEPLRGRPDFSQLAGEGR